MYITVDLGVKATLSRFKLWFIKDDKHFYNDMSPRQYEIWGRRSTIDPATDNGEFIPEWELLGTVENFKPSGLPVGQLSDDDRAAARAGDELEFEYNKFAGIRYIRIRCLRNWSGNTNMCFTEISLWATEIQPID
jgi:hypothetical protein